MRTRRIWSSMWRTLREIWMKMICGSGNWSMEKSASFYWINRIWILWSAKRIWRTAWKRFFQKSAAGCRRKKVRKGWLSVSLWSTFPWRWSRVSGNLVWFCRKCFWKGIFLRTRRFILRIWDRRKRWPPHMMHCRGCGRVSAIRCRRIFIRLIWWMRMRLWEVLQVKRLEKIW